MRVCILNYNRNYTTRHKRRLERAGMYTESIIEITLPGHKRRLERAGMYTELYNRNYRYVYLTIIEITLPGHKRRLERAGMYTEL